MTAIILTFHTLIVLGLIVVVLLQRSDGGALGLGGGGGGFMSGRGAANALTRTTSILAAIFLSTSLALAVLAGNDEDEDSALQDLTTQEDVDAAPASDADLLNTIGADEDDTSNATNAILDAIGAEDDHEHEEGETHADEDAPAEPVAEPDAAASDSEPETTSDEGGEGE